MTTWQSSSRENKPYTLLPYDPSWGEEFEALKTDIAPIFGENLIAFHHVGSTSVPGMLAKPQLDVCAVVKNLEEVRQLRSEFEQRGYIAKGDYVGQDEEYFTYDENDERKYNIHTLQEGNPAIGGYISFRDYLREFPEAVKEYNDVKESLRREYGENDYNSYDWKKGDRIEHLKQQARDWYKDR